MYRGFIGLSRPLRPTTNGTVWCELGEVECCCTNLDGRKAEQARVNVAMTYASLLGCEASPRGDDERLLFSPRGELRWQAMTFRQVVLARNHGLGISDIT